MREECSAAIVLQSRDALVDKRNGIFALAKFALGVEKVVDSRHKVVVIAAVAQIARESCEEADSVISVLHHQHAQHFALIEFGNNIVATVMTQNIVAKQRGSLDAQRVRSVAKRVGEARWQLVGCHSAGKRVKFRVNCHCQANEMVNNVAKIVNFLFVTRNGERIIAG